MVTDETKQALKEDLNCRWLEICAALLRAEQLNNSYTPLPPLTLETELSLSWPLSLWLDAPTKHFLEKNTNMAYGPQGCVSPEQNLCALGLSTSHSHFSSLLGHVACLSSLSTEEKACAVGWADGWLTSAAPSTTVKTNHVCLRLPFLKQTVILAASLNLMFQVKTNHGFQSD